MMAAMVTRDDVAKTKGVGFSNVKNFTVERYGQDGWEQVLARLTQPERDELASIVAVGWYSLPFYAKLIRVIDQVHGYGDLGLLLQLGRYEAEKDLTTLHRMLLRLASPAYAVEKTAEYWRRFHDTGTWTMTREGDSQLRGSLEGWGCVDLALCRELQGYLTRSMELVGAKNVVVDHVRCRTKGEPTCIFVGKWGRLASASLPPPGSAPTSRASATSEVGASPSAKSR